MDAGTIMQNFMYEDDDATLGTDQSQEKMYVRRKWSIKFITICSFIAGIITALLMTTIIIISTSTRVYKTDVHTNQSKGASNTPKDPITDFLGHLVVNVGSKSLWIMNPISKSGHTIEVDTSGRIDAFDYDYRNKTIIWMDKNSTELKSLLQGNRPIETFSRKMKPETFRVDYITGNLYVIDNIAETVSVVNVKNGHFGVVISQITKPHDLVLDPSEGIMFIASKHHSISRVDMNGENLEIVVNGSHVSALAIDCALKNLYFAVDFASIESVNYRGSRRATITKVSTGIASLSIANHSLYWTGESTLWTCEIEETAYGPRCKNDSPTHVSVRNPRAVRFFEPPRQPKADPCEVAACQHLCLLKSSSGHGCACAVGWQLEADGRSCKLVVDYLLYALNNRVRARDLEEPERRSFVDVIYPTEFHTESLRLKRAIDFDYDLRGDRLFFSDDYNIFAMSLKAGELVEQKKLVHVESDYSVKELAYDWLGGNLYYVKRSMTSSHNHEIVALRYTGELSLKHIMHNLPYTEGYGKNCPYSLTVLPDAGSIFYKAFGAESEDIQAFSITRNVSTGLQFLLYFNDQRTLAIDYEESLLYFCSDKSIADARISSMSYNGSNSKILYTTQVPNVVSTYVHRRWMYISNELSIWRLDKLNGGELVQMIDKSDARVLSGMRIVSPTIQAINANNPCAFNNGGCKQFCFESSATKECRCSDDTKNVSKYC